MNITVDWCSHFVISQFVASLAADPVLRVTLGQFSAFPMYCW